MVKQLVLFLALVLLCSLPAAAKPLVVTVQSVMIHPYEEILKGFDSVYDGGKKHFVLSEISQDKIVEKIRRLDPDVVLTIGLDALNTVKPLEHLPIIYTMVLCPDVAGIDRRHITGVCMQVPVEVQLRKMRSVLPNLKRVGLLFDPRLSQQTVSDAVDVSSSLGLTLKAAGVQGPADLAGALVRMKAKVDILWMLPDITVDQPQLLEFFTLFSFENRIPLVTYSEKYMEAGAMVSIGLDAFDMGCQAGEMANSLLAGNDIQTSLPTMARTAVVTVNKTVAEKFGTAIPEDLEALGTIRIWRHQ